MVDSDSYLLPLVVRPARAGVAAGSPTEYAPLPALRLERAYHAGEREILRRGRETEAATRTSLGKQYSGASELTKSFREIVTGTAHHPGELVHAHGIRVS